MRRVALVTYQQLPELALDDALLIEPLLRRDVAAKPAVWDDSTVNWKTFDAVILRSTWDYHLRTADFVAWLAELEGRGVKVYNPVDIIRWNMDKIYQRTLHAHGIHTLPTLWIEQGSTADLKTLLEDRNWEQVVVKPRISASAHKTWILRRSEAAAHQARFAEMAAVSGVMVQKFAPEISDGEWSFVFFGDIYSHAVLKRPAPDSMFVQQEHGGTVHIQVPDPALISQAAHILRVTRRILKADLLYARVDALVTDNLLHLMELELIEPELFLGKGQSEVVERFADAIANVLEPAELPGTAGVG
ncbi:MAG: hypothetical protein OHK0046_21980 [Anaerolineae bacterium]